MPPDEKDDFPVPPDEPDEPKAAPPPRQGSGQKRRADGKFGGAAASTSPRPSTGTAPRPAAPKSHTKALEQVRVSIAEAVGKGGAVAMGVAPLTGGYCVNTADQLADAVTRLAANNPSLLASLSKASVAMDYVALGSWGVGLVVAGMCEAGRMPVDSPIAQRFGVTEVYVELVDTGVLAADDGSQRVDDTDPDERIVAVPDALGGGLEPASA